MLKSYISFQSHYYPPTWSVCFYLATHFFDQVRQVIPRRAIELESCPNPLKMRQIRQQVDSIKRNFGRFCFFVGDVTKRVVLVFLGLLYRALDSDPMYEIFDSNFCGNEAKIQVFRALDWLSSTFGSKVMAKKTKFDKNVKTMICLYQANLCPNTTRLPIELERRLTPLKMREVM